jgi:hypothetical protein
VFDFPAAYYEADREALFAALATALQEECVTLLCGSGCSTGMNLPAWHDLVNSCTRAVLRRPGVTRNDLHVNFTQDSSSDDMFSQMEIVRGILGDVDYLEQVRLDLYRNHGDTLSGEASQLLRAIGGMVTPSRRGTVNKIITLNFDCIIEWYLQSHGLALQIVSRWPTLLRRCDVTVYHPHGYLPISTEFGMRSDRIVFDSTDVDREGAGPSPLRQLFKHLLTSRFILAVGLGGRDYLVRSLLQAVVDTIEEKECPFPLGCWLCTDSVKPAVKDQLRKRGFIILELGGQGSEDILFEIVRRARGPVIC